MEELEKNHILENLDKLVRTTLCGNIFIAKLVSNQVLGLDDIYLIDSIPNALQKSRTLYQLILTRQNSYQPLLEALQTTNQSGAVEVLNRLSTASSSQTESSVTLARNRVRKFFDGEQNQFSSKKTKEDTEGEVQKRKPVRFDVRQPVQLFTGRQQELLELHDKLQQSQTQGITTVVSQMASVSGLGGIGKTELCRRYIQEHGNHYDGNIIWITAEKEETMQESFLRLAKDMLQLSLKAANGDIKDITTIVDEVYNFFSNKRSLFIFDNAESGEHLETFMPFRVVQKPHILITSRDRDWEFEVDVMILHELDEEDAISFVKKGLGINPQDASQNEIILQLVTTLQRFPLALQQTISFIKQQRKIIDYDIHMYLKAFEANAKTLLNSKIPAGSFNTYKRTTFTTWRMTTERIAADEDYGPLAIKILHRIAYLGADNIPRNLLLGLGGEQEVLLALGLLAKYSMIESQPKQCTVSIHRLVQEVTRIELRDDDKEAVTIKETLQLLQKSSHDGRRFCSAEARPQKETKEKMAAQAGRFSMLKKFCSNVTNASLSTVDHSIVAWNYGIKYPELVQEFSNFPCQITKQLFELQRYKEADSFGNKGLLALNEANLDPNHVDVFKIKLQITKAAYQLGNYKESFEVFKNMLPKAYESIGELDPDTIEIEHYIGLALNRLGKYREALQILRGVFDKKKKAFGEDDVRTVDTLLQCKGKYEEALLVHQNAYKKLAKQCGKDYFHTLIAKLEISRIWSAIGMKEDALVSLQEILESQMAHLKVNNRQTLVTKFEIAKVLGDMKRLEESMKLLADVEGKIKEHFGEKHDLLPEVMELMQKLQTS